ncbi:MAG: NYN domain-containing protein [Gemmataceae bacterium]|nr:NYN domain-containing protein [Gemmataceae bacterium]
MSAPASGLRVGVYLDGENVSHRGGRNMRFGRLCEFARRGGAETIRLNAYVAFDHERARHDRAYRDGKRGYHNALREFGFKVIEKPVKWYEGEDGERVSKANADLDLAVDLLTQCGRLDRVLLVSGDGDFARVVNAAQGRGCRVEVVAFDAVSADLRHECDQFVSGYLVPGLLPGRGGPAWGEPGSRVRGTCCTFTDKDYGFLRYFAGPEAGNLEPAEAFFHRKDGPPDFDYGILPSRDVVFEFTLGEDRGEKLAARDVQVVADYAGRGPCRKKGSPAEACPTGRDPIRIAATH